MPSNTHKSAAVPFINQKGERSMKRVKVERYVAGKKPTYAKDDDEEEEYYTEEDEEDDDDIEDQEDEDDEEDEDGEDGETVRAFRSGRNLDYSRKDDDEDDDSSSSDIGPAQKPAQSDAKPEICSSNIVDDGARDDDDDDDDDDDPRFRRLKQIESKTRGSQLIDVQRTQLIQPKYELKNVVLDEDDEEEEIRRRHAVARKRQLEIPIAKPDEIKQDDEDDDSKDGTNSQPKRLDTDDLLKDLKLTGISRTVREKLKTNEEEEAEQMRLKEMIEQAKQEASFTRKTHEKIDEDIKKEVEKEALAKGDIGAREMTSVNTDDEDDELAYEEWKLREIKRVLRDRSERMLTSVR